MKHQSETPFDNIESSHAYVALLAEAVEEAIADVDADIAVASSDHELRRKQALQLVRFKLDKLQAHMQSSRRVLNDLRTLRRLLLNERETDREEAV